MDTEGASVEPVPGHIEETKGCLECAGGLDTEHRKDCKMQKGQRTKKSKLSGPHDPQKRQGNVPANLELTHHALSQVADKSAAISGRVIEWSAEKTSGARAARCMAESGNRRLSLVPQIGRSEAKSRSGLRRRIN